MPTAGVANTPFSDTDFLRGIQRLLAGENYTTEGNNSIVAGLGATVTINSIGGVIITPAAALADSTVNPTPIPVGAYMMAWNGSVWNRVKLGQQTMANSIAVTIASNQGASPSMISGPLGPTNSAGSVSVTLATDLAVAPFTYPTATPTIFAPNSAASVLSSSYIVGTYLIGPFSAHPGAKVLRVNTSVSAVGVGGTVVTTILGAYPGVTAGAGTQPTILATPTISANNVSTGGKTLTVTTALTASANSIAQDVLPALYYIQFVVGVNAVTLAIDVMELP